MTDLRLATLLSSKICHDLISPVGAINNGLEILSEVGDDDAMREQALGLIQGSAAAASAKLQFMRLAYGVAGTVSESLSLEEVRGLLDGLVQGTQVELGWHAGTNALDKVAVKLLLNMALLGYEALPRGGRLQIGVRKEGATNLMVAAEGSVVRFSDSAEAILRDGGDLATLEAKNVTVFIARELAASLKTEVLCNTGADRVEFSSTF